MVLPSASARSDYHGRHGKWGKTPLHLEAHVPKQTATKWKLITAAFALQILGVMVVAPLLRLQLETFRSGLLILVAGTVFALYLSRAPRFLTNRAWPCWVPPLLYAGFIFSLSSQSFPGVELPTKADYFHPIEYGFLGFFLGWAWRTGRRGSMGPAWAALVLVSGILFGASDEWHQAFVPGRDPSMLDLCWDALGIVLGMAFYHMIEIRFRSQRPAAAPEQGPHQGMSVNACSHIVQYDAEAAMELPVQRPNRPGLADIEQAEGGKTEGERPEGNREADHGDQEPHQFVHHDLPRVTLAAMPCGQVRGRAGQEKQEPQQAVGPWRRKPG